MLGVLATHPIQYQAPIWRGLAARGDLPLRVMYLSEHGQRRSFDPGFGREMAWDIDLLSGYPHEFLPAREGEHQESFWWLRTPRHFARHLRDAGVQVLWVQGWQVAAYWQAIQTARSAGIEVWLRGDTNLRSGASGPRQRLKRVLLRQLFDRVDRFLAVGEANAAFYRSMGVPEARIGSAPHCVDNSRFARAHSDLVASRDEIRAGWGIAQDASCVLFVGKFVDKKRPLDLVEAARRLRDSAPSRKLHLLFAGDGELRESLRQAASDARLDASFTGFLNQSEIPRAYAAADLLALPSDGTETWGLVVNEAMAGGLPCVVSSSCGCAEDLVLPLRPDLCFPLGDVDALATSLRAAMDSPPPATVLRDWVGRYDVACTVGAVAADYLSRPRAGTVACGSST